MNDHSPTLKGGLFAIRARIAAMDPEFMHSATGRKLLAKILWAVRKQDGRDAAKAIREDMILYEIMP